MTARPDDLRIRFRRSGGLAGVPLEVTGRLDDLDLPDDVRARLRELAAGGVAGADSAAGPDGFTYLLRLEQEGAAREVRWTDGTLAPDLATVVASLVRLARPTSAGR
jgi:hypothetical protein